MTVGSGVASVPVRARFGGFTASDVATIAGCFVVSRVLLTVIGIVVLNAHTVPFHNPMQTHPFEPSVPDLYVRWDSFWYVEIARHGYSVLSTWVQPGATAYAFYPVYPALMWAVSTASGLSVEMSGVVVSNVAFLAALFVIFRLAERWSGDKAVAGLCVALLSFAPESFIFSAVYTESLFLLLASGAMLLHERQQNALAGLVAAIAAASRSNGVLLVVYFGLTVVRERGLVGALRIWQQPERYLPIVMTPLGLFAFWWFAMLTTGDAFAQKSTVAHGWHWVTDLPWNNIVRHLTGNLRSSLLMGLSLAAFAASLTLLRRDSWPLFVYCLVNFLLFWSGTLPNSLLRYAIVLFPIFFGLSRMLAHRIVPATLLLLLFVALDALLMGLWAIGSPFVL